MKNQILPSIVAGVLVLGASTLSAADSSSYSRQNNTTTKSAMSDHQPVCVSKIIGKSVKNDQDQTIGEVKDLVINNSSVQYAIVSTGGAAGIGAKQIAVPMSSLQCSGNEIRMSATKEDLKAASSTPQGAWTVVQGQAWTKNVDGFYGSPSSLNSTRFERESAEPESYNRESVRSNQKGAERTMDSISTQGGAVSTTDANLTDADRNLRQQVNDTLQSQNSANPLQVSAQNGTVTLRGTVATEAQKQQIESQVSRMSGVQHVNNELEVSK